MRRPPVTSLLWQTQQTKTTSWGSGFRKSDLPAPAFVVVQRRVGTGESRRAFLSKRCFFFNVSAQSKENAPVIFTCMAIVWPIMAGTVARVGAGRREPEPAETRGNTWPERTEPAQPAREATGIRTRKQNKLRSGPPPFFCIEIKNFRLISSII